MQRTYLENGDILELNNKIYTVKSVLGDGATCVVYSAEYKDNSGYSHKVNIKECYPYNAIVSRDGSLLNWEMSDEKEQSLKAFETTYKKLNMWQEEITNVSVYDICDANNTKYIIMEHSKSCITFDKDKPESLSDILNTVNLLAHYVGKYHQNGYLHLDIKPSNFLVYPRPSDHIVLFDLDTVTAISDIESGKCMYAAYSDGWAAPEQKQGKIHKFCPATDIYAIGAVLFEKIMGRQVNNDDIGYFAEWDFEGELFENINPKIKRLLTNIFKKTLAASVKRRYQTTDALINDLNKAIKIAESEVYLKGDDICCSGCFIGRENELRLIKESFDNKKKIVFLHGFGGIGKTEIARKYAELYKKDYDVVLFVRYDSNSTLQDKLDEIDIVNFDGDTIEHRKKLRNLLDDKTLVIIDNFDVEIGADNGLKVLFATKAHILVSTRTDFSSVYNGDKYTQIEIQELVGYELEQVFFSNAKIDCLNKYDKEILYKVFKLIENHTYATELLAKQMYSSGWSFEALYEKVKSGFASLSDAEKIVVNKDEDTKKDNSLNILRAVFRISELTEGQKQVLRNMSLLSFVKITKKLYKEFSSCETLNDFNVLLEKGYIKFEQGYFVLHTLTKQLTHIDLNPNMNSCVEVYDYVYKEINSYDRFSTIVCTAELEQAKEKGDFIDRFLKECNYGLLENIKLALVWFSKLIACEKDIIIRFIKNEKELVGKLLNVLDEEKNVEFIVCLWGLKFLFILYTSKDINAQIGCLDCFLAKLGTGNNNYLRIVCSHVNRELSINDVSKDIFCRLYSLEPESFNLSWENKEKYDIPLNENDVIDKKAFNDKIFEFERKRINAEFALEELYGVDYSVYDTDDEYDNYNDHTGDSADNYGWDYDDDVYNHPIEKLFECLADDMFFYDYFDECIDFFNWKYRLEEFCCYERTKILINLLYTLLDKFDYTNENKNLIDKNWEEISELVSMAEDYFDSAYLKNVDEDEIEEIQQYLFMLRSIESCFCEGWRWFIEDISKLIVFQRDDSSNEFVYTSKMKYVMKICDLSEKCSWIVPYMYKCIKKSWPLIKIFGIKSFYPILSDLLQFTNKAIVEVADFNSSSRKEIAEVIDINKFSEKLKNISTFCEKWLNIIIGKKFELKEETNE